MRATSANLRWVAPLGLDDPIALDPALPETRSATQRGKGLSIRFEHAGKSFGARQVLSDLDLSVAAGQFVAIVGRSGGGKTTLLRLLTGLDQPSSGRVLIDDAPVTGLQATVRLLFQDARLLPWQRVISNVGIARMPGWREAAQAALADVGLADRAQDWPSVLSGGQRQRVALARALVNHPGVLLLDEPFGALDALTRQEMHQLVTQIWQSHGFTTVLITHDVREAVTLADRVLVLREGRIALDLVIPNARPRLTGNVNLAALEAAILKEV
ncbi:MAG TPA: ATP-binding cassette domain-containing protein [Burkholderiales bacterium]|jgi:sulfonate transport system ATP-binding protein|nr:ATP-binding cassette domain-containing protein [Burkholderiales bacterium]